MIQIKAVLFALITGLGSLSLLTIVIRPVWTGNLSLIFSIIQLGVSVYIGSLTYLHFAKSHFAESTPLKEGFKSKFLQALQSKEFAFLLFPVFALLVLSLFNGVVAKEMSLSLPLLALFIIIDKIINNKFTHFLRIGSTFLFWAIFFLMLVAFSLGQIFVGWGN